MGIDLTMVDVRGIVLSEETVAQIAEKLGVEYDEDDPWEGEEQINNALPKGISLARAEDSMSGDVSIPYLAVDRYTTSYDAKRSTPAGIYALSDKPYRLNPEEFDALEALLAGTDDEGAEIQTFVAYSIS